MYKHCKCLQIPNLLFEKLNLHIIMWIKSNFYTKSQTELLSCTEYVAVKTLTQLYVSTK